MKVMRHRPGRRVLINPAEIVPNPAIDDVVWDKFVSLPSQSLPQKVAKPVKRLTALAQELASDNLIKEQAKKRMQKCIKFLTLPGQGTVIEIATARAAVLTVEGKTLKADLKDNEKSFDDFLEEADFVVIEDAYRRAARGISPDLARTYAEFLAEKNDESDSIEDALIEAHADIAALGLVIDVQEYLDTEADKLAKQWLEENRVSIKSCQMNDGKLIDY